MKRNYFLLIFGVIFLFSCEKETIDSEIPNLSINNEVVFNGKYLEFKSIEAFDSINSFLIKTDNIEFSEWEKGLGFISARSVKEEFEKMKESVNTEEEYNDLEKIFSDRLRFQSDGVVRYKFYNSSFSSVLNEDGEVKIGGVFYKFTNKKEYISLDGDEDRVYNAQRNLKSSYENDDNLIIYPNSDNQKSEVIQTIDEGVKEIEGDDDIKRRLVWSLERCKWVILSHYDYTYLTYVWKYGYYLTLSMNQEKWRGLFLKDWRSNEASYNIENIYIDWAGDDPVGHTGSLPDQSYGTTRSTVYYSPIDRLYLTYGYDMPPYLDFILYQLDMTFWSSGIGEENAIDINL